MDEIKYLIYTTDLEDVAFIKKNKAAGIECIPAMDARSAAYLATGICAQNQEKVFVCVHSGNASRSVFSGMTEAFYRKLPIILITFGKQQDYSKELNDVVEGHYIISNIEEIESLQDLKAPMHIEVWGEDYRHDRIHCKRLQELLSEATDTATYIYISNAIEAEQVNFQGKVVCGGMPDCYEGALANVLGASLSQKRKRYIGLVSEDEFLHDINTLGNININDLIFYIVITGKKNNLIKDYALSLQFEVEEIQSDKLQINDIRRLNLNQRKTLLIVYEEE